MSDETKSVFEVIWHIENAKPWLKSRDDFIYSPSFLAETLMNTRWKLRLSSNWQLAEKYVSITLQRDVVDDHTELIDINYEISLLASDGSSLKSKECMKKFAPKTISRKLNVKQDVILDEKNGAYLCKGVMAVCCKLWKKSVVSNQGKCSLRSVIGTQKLYLKEKIRNFSPPSVVPVSFRPPSTDITQVCLDVYVSEDEFIFERKHIECKSISWCACKLFALNSKGYKTEFDEKISLTEESLPSKNREKLQSISTSDFFFRYLPDDTLTLQLEVSYFPGIVSEGIESKSNAILPGRGRDLQSLNVQDSKMFPNLSESSDEDEDESDNKGEFGDGDASLMMKVSSVMEMSDDEGEFGDGDESDDGESGDGDESDDEGEFGDEDESLMMKVSSVMEMSDDGEFGDGGESDDGEFGDGDESDDEDEYFCTARKKNSLSSTFKENLNSLWNYNFSFDTKLRTDTEIFFANRTMLSVRSPVFKKMFTTDMKEKAGECVYVPDVSSDTMRRMLRFIYTGRTGDLEM